ncbi:MAG: twin-arginine translocase TatA/TatE family subunit [Myxococcota bacterium]
MFDIGAGELLMVALVALLVLQPRDLPKLMRSLGGALALLRRRQADLHRMIVTMERKGDHGWQDETTDYRDGAADYRDEKDDESKGDG